MWVRSNETLNVNAPLTVNGTDGYLRLSNNALTGSATVINTANGHYEAHGGNDINFKGGSGSYTNHASNPFGKRYDGVSIWEAGTYIVEECNAHLGVDVTNLNLTQEGNTWTATNK